jgi:di/tricarboxylate transporter
VGVDIISQQQPQKVGISACLFLLPHDQRRLFSYVRLGCILTKTFSSFIMSSDGLTEGTLRGTAIGLMVVTTAVVLARAILRSDQKKLIQWDEIWLMMGYLLFMAVTGVYINKTSLLFRLLPKC